jgi:hypothetical protein
MKFNRVLSAMNSHKIIEANNERSIKSLKFKEPGPISLY